MILITTVIRLILTVALLYGVYTETGIWTTLFATLVCISAETNTALFKQYRERLNEHAEAINKINRKHTPSAINRAMDEA